MKGTNYPEEKNNIKTCEGHTIPLGKIVKDKERTSCSYYRPEYSEYIVAREENIMVRYVIRFGGDKEYSDKDLYNKSGDDGINDNDDDPMDGPNGDETDSDYSSEESV